MLSSGLTSNPPVNNLRKMDKGRLILEAILLLQASDVKSKRLPLWHYALDYSLTLVFLSLYGFGIYSLIDWLI
tara:strand:- start:545 stop:763 length:219 start_codon:yes stop_codon:yes gene_type:complete